MASLDRMEGDLIEIIGIVLLVIIAYIAYQIWKAANGTKGWWQAFVEAVQSLGRGAMQGLQNPEQAYSGPFQNPLSPETVATGTNAGNWGNGVVATNADGTSVSDYYGGAVTSGDLTLGNSYING